MPVPFGFGFGDLTKAIKLSRDIYVKCFEEDASVKYREFINDIGALSDGLSRLKGVVEATERYYPHREWRNDAQIIGGAHNLLSQLTGDFYQTLKECRSLLARHGRLQSGHARAFDNLNWWLSVEGAVDNLMDKLKFHITKIEFYARPSELEMIIRQGREIQNLRNQVANIERIMLHGAQPSTKPWAEVVPVELRMKFEHALETRRPSWLPQGSEWPLRETFEALVFHFARGTVNFRPVSGCENMPEVQQFLHLAKALWIFETLRESQNLQVSSNDWADYMREMEDDLRGQLYRFEARDLRVPSTEELVGLSDDSYTIGQSENTEQEALDAEEAGPVGEQLLQLTLTSNSSENEVSLSIFRESDIEFTFIKSMRQTDVLGAPRSREVEVFMDRHRLIPIYASPTHGGSSRNSIIIANERGKRPTEYAFHDLEDVKKLQHALLGYRVHHHMPIMSWRVDGAEANIRSGGWLQLWQYKPLPPMPASNLSIESVTDSSFESTGSPKSSLKLSRCNTASSYDTRRLSSALSNSTRTSRASVLSPIQGPRQSGTHALQPEPPVLVIFTLRDDRYSFLFVPLDANIYVNARACSCRNPKLRCERVILESKQKNFTVRTLAADQNGDQGLDSWDLSTFRLPRSEKFEKAVKNEKAKTLALRFSDVEEKDLFLEEYLSLIDCRTVDQNDYEKVLREQRRRADQPRRARVLSVRD